MEIKEQWEEFKTSDMDKLVAKVSHGDSSKASRALQVTPNPRVIVNFRPNSNWKGEFGFDWLRVGDTKLFGDNKYEDIVSQQYTDATFANLQMDGNEYGGHFKKDAKLFEALQKTYESYPLPWSSGPSPQPQNNTEKYYMPWMSLLLNKEAKIELRIDIKQGADYIEFEDSPYFDIIPKKIDIKGKIGLLKANANGKVFTVAVKCKKTFAQDQEIIINSFMLNHTGNPTKVLAGKIKAWANDVSKQKEKEVVFVQIKTPPISTLVELKGKATNEKNRINNYLNQAFIKLHKNSKIIDLDLTSDKDFLKFVKNRNVDYENPKDSEQLEDFLKKKLKKDFKGAYNNHFKAFYLAESGGASGTISGYSLPKADFVVVFKSANDQTASHEFLHAFNLAHSFANKAADVNATFTYEYIKTDNLLDYSHHIAGHESSRCSLWYWQWKKANNSIP